MPTEPDEVVSSPPDEVDALIDRYVRECAAEARTELASSEAVREAEHLRLRAAFNAGAPILTLVPVELYDPHEGRVIRVGGGTLLRVAGDEGDIQIDLLADNSHSIGVLYEEHARWSTRKYFLPLRTLCHPARIRIDVEVPEVKVTAREVRGLEQAGTDEKTASRVQEIEQAAERDDRAVLPRGTWITLRFGATLTDALGQEHVVAAGTRVLVREAVGDFSRPDDEVAPPIPVMHEDTPYTLPFETLSRLDLKTEVLSPRAHELRQLEQVSRRRALHRTVGIGAAVGFLLLDVGVAAQAKPEPMPLPRGLEEGDRERYRQATSLLVPEIALLSAYFSSGGKYWFDLEGLMFELKSRDCLPPTTALAHALSRLAEASQLASATYESTFHRRVHTHWSEQRHYTTDKEGKQRYSHSTYSKGYRQMWCESPALSGQSATVLGFARTDNERHAQAQRLLNERIFNLLASTPEQAERDFRLMRQDLDFGKDALKSVLVAALMTLPAAFYDDLIAWGRGERIAVSPMGPSRSAFSYQKNVLQMAGLAAGIALASSKKRALDQQLAQNKYGLGQQLEAQLRRVPTLDFDEAFRLFFSAPSPDEATVEVDARGRQAAEIARGAVDFTFVYGDGWDNGRPLDPEYIDASRVRSVFGELSAAYPRLAFALQTSLTGTDVRERLVLVLRNAIGTDVLEEQMTADRGEASAGGMKQAAWLAVPVWGATVLDAVLRGFTRAG